MLGTDYHEHFWSYPPHLLLFIWPFGLVALSAGLYRLVRRRDRALSVGLFAGVVARRYWLFLAVAPGVAVYVFFGQNGFLTAAL